MEIKEIIRKLSQNNIPNIVWCKVLDINGNTCSCEPIDGRATFHNVKLNANDQKYLISPKINSIVGIVPIDNYNAVVAIWSEIENITIVGCKDIEIEAQSVKIGKNTEKAVKGESLNNLLQELITHLQTLNATLISYGTAQAAELPVIAASNTTLVSAMTAETAKIASWTAKLQKHISKILNVE